MDNFVNIAFVVVCVIVSACQIKQAFFPVIYTDAELVGTGVEVPNDADVSLDNPVFKMMMEAYDKANTCQTPTEFIQREIIDDTGVEIITDKDEWERM